MLRNYQNTPPPPPTHYHQGITFLPEVCYMETQAQRLKQNKEYFTRAKAYKRIFKSKYYWRSD